MKKLLLLPALLMAFSAIAEPLISPDTSKLYNICSKQGDVLSWDGNTLKVLPLGDANHQIVTFALRDTVNQYYNISFQGVNGYLASANATGWDATLTSDPDTLLAQFEIWPSESNPDYVNLIIIGQERGEGMLGFDSNSPVVYTDKSDGANSIWQILEADTVAPEVTAVTLHPGTLSLAVNKKAQLTAGVEPLMPARFKWASSDSHVAGVTQTGVVTAISPGDAIITVTFGGKSATCAVEVTGSDAYASHELPDSDPRKHAYDGYKLVFAEEFSTDGNPDYSIWNLEDGYKRNNEDQYYLNPNSEMGKALGINPAYVQDGVLVIEARHDNLPNPLYGRLGQTQETIPYTSASLQTKGNANGGYSWLYGIYEVRAKITAEEGLWPAIWSTGEQYEWPYGGEIDIMEYYGNRLHANVCWGNGGRWSGSWNSKTVHMSKFSDDWDQDFHIWRMIWDYDHMVLMVDSLVVNDIDLNTTVNVNPRQNWYNVDNLNPFRDVRQMGWVNLALGGNNGGSLANTVFPSYYLIDYFRVYQLEGSDGKATYHVDEDISYPSWGPFAGVENVAADSPSSAPEEYYDLCGRKVPCTADMHGIFVVKKGNTVKKVFK